MGFSKYEAFFDKKLLIDLNFVKKWRLTCNTDLSSSTTQFLMLLEL